MEDIQIPLPQKSNPHRLYAAVALILGLIAVGSWSYFNYQNLEFRKAEEARQASVKAATDKNNRETAEKEARERSVNQTLLNLCMQTANAEYNEYLEINGTKQGSGEESTYWMPQYRWDYIEKKTRDEKDLCLKKYPQT